MRGLLLVLAALTVGCTSTRDLVYVTPAFGEGVAAVRPDTLEVAWKRAPLGPVRTGRPMHLALGGGKLWVGDLDGPGVFALDPQTGETLHAVKLPHEVVGIALSPDGKTLVTAARDALEAYVVDTETGALRGSVVTGEVAAVSSRPAYFTGHPFFESAGRAFVQDNVNATIVAIDTDAPTKAGLAGPDDLGPVHCFDRVERTGWFVPWSVAIAEGSADRRYSPRLALWEPGWRPLRAARSADRLIDIPLDWDETPRLHHGCFSKDGRFYYVANMGPLKAATNQGHTVALVDVQECRVLKRGRAGRGAGHPILSPDGATLYVVNHSESFVSVLDARTLATIGQIDAARAPAFGHGVVFTKEGALLVLASADHELVKIVDGKVAGRLDLGAELGEMEKSW